jgi:hypothetical protein
LLRWRYTIFHFALAPTCSDVRQSVHVLRWKTYSHASNSKPLSSLQSVSFVCRTRFQLFSNILPCRWAFPLVVLSQRQHAHTVVHVSRRHSCVRNGSKQLPVGSSSLIVVVRASHQATCIEYLCAEIPISISILLNVCKRAIDAPRRDESRMCLSVSDSAIR